MALKMNDTQTVTQSMRYNLFTEATVYTTVETDSVSDESSLQVSVEESLTSELKTDSKCLYYTHVSSI